MVLEGLLDDSVDLFNDVLRKHQDDLALERPEQQLSLVPLEEEP